MAGAVLLQPAPPIAEKRVADPPSTVLLRASDIPEAGWGERASGLNGSAAWRVFGGHSEYFLAIFNVTLWVEANASAARIRMDRLTGAEADPAQYGGVPGADDSAFWPHGRDADIVVLRFNVVFRIAGTSETPMSLTKSDLGSWSGWQLQRIESLAA